MRDKNREPVFILIPREESLSDLGTKMIKSEIHALITLGIMNNTRRGENRQGYSAIGVYATLGMTPLRGSKGTKPSTLSTKHPDLWNSIIKLILRCEHRSAAYLPYGHLRGMMCAKEIGNWETMSCVPVRKKVEPRFSTTKL